MIESDACLVLLLAWCLIGMILGFGVSIMLVNEGKDYRNIWVKAFFLVAYGPFSWALVGLSWIIHFVFKYTGKFFIKLFVNKGDKS